jgi:hypothetical protein
MQFNNAEIQDAYNTCKWTIDKQIKFIQDMDNDFLKLEQYLSDLGEMNFIYKISAHETLVYTNKLTYHDSQKGFVSSIHDVSSDQKQKIYNEIPGFLYKLANFFIDTK